MRTRHAGRKWDGRTIKNPMLMPPLIDNYGTELTPKELVRNGISPYSEFSYCRKCAVYYRGKPLRCDDCHGLCRQVDRCSGFNRANTMAQTSTWMPQ